MFKNSKYDKNSDLPNPAKALPNQAQDVWRSAFNNAFEEYGDESQAYATAWTAVEKEYKKENGEWVTKGSSLEGWFDGGAGFSGKLAQRPSTGNQLDEEEAEAPQNEAEEVGDLSAYAGPLIARYKKALEMLAGRGRQRARVRGGSPSGVAVACDHIVNLYPHSATPQRACRPRLART